MRLLIVAILSVVLLTACGESERTDRLLQQAYAIADTKPDSALVMLKSVCRDSLPNIELKYYHDLLTIKANDKAYITHSSDSSYGTIRAIDPNLEYIDLDYVDPFVENKFVITAINANGEKQSEIIIWGGDEFSEYLEDAYSLETTTDNNNIVLSIENEELDYSSVVPRSIQSYEIVSLVTIGVVDKRNEKFGSNKVSVSITGL